MVERRDPAVFSIPPTVAFADALVDGLIVQFGSDPMILARGIILVPNNRAAIAIQDAFVRRGEKGLLLPRLVPVGDPELSENVGSALDPIDIEPIPPAIDPLQRQLMLAKLLEDKKTGPLDAAQAMRLAAELGSVLDQLTFEKKTTQDLHAIDVGALNQHWDEAFALLGLIHNEWPEVLRELGFVDLADRRNRQLERVTERWRRDPPAGFVVAAGISTTAPAIAGLIAQVARLEKGQVILAGLDFDMPKYQWEALFGDESEPAIESHPQFHLRLLLHRMRINRDDVLPWKWAKADKARSVRGKAITMGLAPAQFTRAWSQTAPAERKLAGVSAIELANPAEEAQSIALALREAIEIPGQTAALVTPDRALAKRVAAHLKRWGIEADDSAGQSLSATQPGGFLLALATAAAEQFAPVPLLALLKHPLSQAGEDRQAWIDGARALDLALRGPRPAPHLAGISALLEQRTEYNEKQREAAAHWWPQALVRLEPLEAQFASASTLTLLLEGLRDAASALAGDAVWSGQEGRAVADLVANLIALAVHGPTRVSPETLPQMLRDLMEKIAIRPARGGHPRLFIWGLLEAKLQSADLMILAGLNEGSWPQLSSPDPWLAPAVRRQLELPSLERRIGLSAHDLACAMSAKSVLLTRSKRDASAPTKASRFWLRLETLINGFELPRIRYDLLAHALDHAPTSRTSAPSPSPPVDERPRKLSVTDVDRLLADPYSFYAKTMLKLSELEAPGAEPDNRWRGTFLHDVLHQWGDKDKYAVGKLLPRLKAAFDTSGLHPVVRALWEPRFEEAAAFFEEKVAENLALGRVPLSAEEKGSAEISGVKLTGRADRIDRLEAGSFAVIDYKTGEPPSAKSVKAGMRLQLGLIGALAERGAYKGVTGSARAFEYWSQARDQNSRAYGMIKSPIATKPKEGDLTADDFVVTMLAQFEAAIEHYLFSNAPFEAKLHPEYAFGEFDHLMRYDEWRGRDGT